MGKKKEEDDMADGNPDERPPESANATPLEGPGKKPVGVAGIIVLAAYLVFLALFLLHGTAQLLKINPSEKDLGTPANSLSALPPAAGGIIPEKVETAKPEALRPTPEKEGAVPIEPGKKDKEAAKAAQAGSVEAKCWTVKFLIFGEISVSQELRLVLIVILTGALGSLVHALRSLSWYIGNRQLVASWIAMYGLLPFMGAALAVIFYLVIRGGFFSAAAGSEQTSPFGFAALAALVGMFSEQAIRKLKTIAEGLFAKGEKGSDHAEPRDESAPAPSAPNNAPPGEGSTPTPPAEPNPSAGESPQTGKE